MSVLPAPRSPRRENCPSCVLHIWAKDYFSKAPVHYCGAGGEKAKACPLLLPSCRPPELLTGTDGV